MDTATIDKRLTGDGAGKQAGGGKVRLLTLSDLDRRTAAFRNVSALIDSIKTDVAGSRDLTTGEQQIVQRVAVLGAVLEDMESRWLAGEALDAASYCTVINAQRRLLETIGTDRKAKDVTSSLQTYLAGRGGQA